MWLMLQNDVPENFVVSTGVAATVRDFCSMAFDVVGLDWKDYVKTDENYLRPLEVEYLLGDSSSIEAKLGWKYKTDWKGLAKIMVEADLALIHP